MLFWEASVHEGDYILPTMNNINLIDFTRYFCRRYTGCATNAKKSNSYMVLNTKKYYLEKIRFDLHFNTSFNYIGDLIFPGRFKQMFFLFFHI